jgi:hypothetical protein
LGHFLLARVHAILARVSRAVVWLLARAGRGVRASQGPMDDHLLFEAALQRIKDSAPPLSRREAFRAVWRERQWGSDADADLAEQRFAVRLAAYRAGHVAPPAKWLRPGSCLAEALGAPAEAADPGHRQGMY